MRKANLSRDSTGGFGSREGQGCCVGWRNNPALPSPCLGSHKPQGTGRRCLEESKIHRPLLPPPRVPLSSWEEFWPHFSPFFSFLLTNPYPGVGNNPKHWSGYGFPASPRMLQTDTHPKGTPTALPDKFSGIHVNADTSSPHPCTPKPIPSAPNPHKCIHEFAQKVLPVLERVLLVIAGGQNLFCFFWLRYQAIISCNYFESCYRWISELFSLKQNSLFKCWLQPSAVGWARALPAPRSHRR